VRSRPFLVVIIPGATNTIVLSTVFIDGGYIRGQLSETD
jgi:hypothetical protein